MSFYGKDNFATSEDNWLPTSTGSGGRNADFPLLIAPKSLTILQETAGVIGNGLRNLSGVSDIVMKSTITATDRDLLGGGTIQIINDPIDGSEMLAYTNPDTSVSFQKYVAASAASGPVGQAASVTNPLDGLGGTTHALFTTSPKDNVLLFLCCYVPLAATAAAVGKVGFDIGGFNYTVASGDTITRALCVNMGDGTFTIGAVDTNTFGGSDERAEALFGALSTGTQYGRISIVMGVNGPAGTNYSVRSILGVSTDAIGILDNTVTAEWGNAWTGGAATNNSINLGDGCPTDFGVYFMGIRNYDQAITESEVKRVARVMTDSAKLPGWW